MQNFPQRVTFLLGSIVIILTILGVMAISGQRNAFGEATLLFDLDYEISVPNWFSVILLFVLSATTFTIALTETARKNRFSSHWQWLVIIFLLMSIEESASFRDSIITIPLRDLFNLSGIFYFSWVIPVGILTLVFIVSYLRFFRQLPNNVRNFFLLGFFVYVSGAIGGELISGWLITQRNDLNIYSYITTFEELLEMMGMILILHALLLYICRDTWHMISPEKIKGIRINFSVLVGGIAVGLVFVATLAYISIRDRDYVSLATLHMWDNLPMEAPPNQEPTIFGNDMPLWGTTYSYEEDWNLIDINLWWWTQTAPEDNYSIGIYLLNSSGLTVAQTDGAINDLYYETVETSQMEANRIYVDQRIITIPEDLPAGDYSLHVAVYQWWDGVKLELSNGEDLLHIGDVIIP